MKLVFALFALASLAAAHAEPAARGLIQRVLPAHASQIVIEEIAAENGRDVFEVESSAGQIVLRGNNGVAVAAALNWYLKNVGHCQIAWAGSQLTLPATLPAVTAKVRVASPYAHRFYFNVVTYGYTMPYWTWDRWEQELDWMALHGMNLPLALVGTEAIGERVWKKLGLTQAEIDEFYTGPAHLPWQRMGNLAKLDGPLPASWHADQVALQHKILNRMRELGIEPIVPGFAGFVPVGLKRVHPEITLHELRWSSFPRNHLLAPGTPLFAEIGKLFVQEWEKEFGTCRYYLADSFNEMDLPKTGKPVTELLADYGAAIYQPIAAANSNAVWVIQGWMFGYQRNIWNKDTVKALLSKVPDDKMLILDEACDYNGVFWRNGMNWELFDGFHNKPWIYGVIPNMGGKTPWNGVLDFYATDASKALTSPKKGRLVGFGFAPEGIENNDVIYELLADMAWRTTPIDLDVWLAQYCRNRYGGYPATMTAAWKIFRQTCYGTFTDHPHFGWQHGGCGYGTVNRDPRFFQGVQQFLAGALELRQSPLYRADALELAATALSLKADDWFVLARAAHDAGNAELRDRAANRGLELLSETDRLLESHPLDRLARWLDFARAHGPQYESNARRIVTVWGPPVNDYSCRLWSGLIRDFYRERMARYFDGLRTGKGFNRGAWEEQWVRGTGVSRCEPFADPVAAAVKLVNVACAETLPKVVVPAGEVIGDWVPAQVSTEWKTVEWRITTAQLKKLTGVYFRYTGGHHRLDVQWVAVIADGQEIARDEHFGYAGVPNSQNLYRLKIPTGARANNDCVIRASVRSAGGTDSHGVIELR